LTLPFWEDLAGVSFREPARFIAALLEKDNGKLLTYFHLISRLPLASQRFLAQSAARFKRFYRAFPFSERQSLKDHRFTRGDVYFEELLRELPLDTEGRVDFPGGAELWSRLAAGGSGRARQLRWQIAADEDDHILLNLATSRYQRNGLSRPLTEVLLAVVRLQRHRDQSMDERLATLLSEKYARYQELFPYLASLPNLTHSQIDLFFQAAGHLETLDGRKLNLALSGFHSLIQWLILLSANGALPSEELVRLFATMSQGFAKAKTDADFAGHSCNMVLQITSALQSPSPHRIELAASAFAPGDQNASHTTAGQRQEPAFTIEETLFQALAGASREVEFAVGDRRFQVNYSARRKQRMQEVFELQSIMCYSPFIRSRGRWLRMVPPRLRLWRRLEPCCLSCANLHRKAGNGCRGISETR
jgi:hypothetical protein